MRTLLTIILLLLSIGIANAQTGQSKITLKNGTVITGVVKSIDPAGDVVISLSGENVNLKMSDVAKIEAIPENGNTITNTNVRKPTPEDLVVTDHANYPETYDLKIGNETLKMVLVRGGDFNMGYDGEFSTLMDSEPVHRVGVTSFYMSETFVPINVVSEVTGKSKKNGYYKVKWRKATEIATKIADKVGLPVRLPLEAEWEYAACSDKQEILFEKCNKHEFCSDLFREEFQDLDYKIDPTGPKKGKLGKHAIRAYNQKKGKHRRMGAPTDYEYVFRLVIKAKDIK